METSYFIFWLKNTPQKGLRDGVEKGLNKFEMSSVQAPVVQKVDSAIHWINLYPVDSAIFIGFPNTYPLDSDLSGG